MIKLVKKLCQNAASRIIFVLVITLIFIGCGFGFLTNEMVQNREYYLRHYEENQKELTKQLADQVQEQLGHEIDVVEIGKNLEGKEINATYRWCYFGTRHELYQAKDANYHDKLQLDKVTTIKKLHEWLDDKNQIETYTEFDFNGQHYTVGIVSDKDNVILESKTGKHTIYVMMAVGLLSMVLFASILLLVILLNRKDKQLRNCSQEMEQLNLKLEELASTIVEDDAYAEVAASVPEAVYEDEMVRALLKKTKDARLFPVTVAVLHVTGPESNILDMYKRWNQTNEKNRILLPIGERKYAMLLYRMTLEEVNEMLARIGGICSEESVLAKLNRRTFEQASPDELLAFYENEKERIETDDKEVK